jgi:hypothetical protein
MSQPFEIINIKKLFPIDTILKFAIDQANKNECEC